LDKATIEYEKALKTQDQIDAYLRLTLIEMLKLNGNQCLKLIETILELDAVNEKAFLYKGYCFEIEGDIQKAKESFDSARAMEIRGADRFYSMPSGYSGYILRGAEGREFRGFYLPALIGGFVYTEYFEFGIGGKDRWIHSLLSFQSQYGTLSAMIKAFKEKEILILKGILSSFEGDLLHKYYQQAMEYLPNKETFVTSCVNDRVGYFYNQKFRPFVSTLSGKPLQPTYSYFVNYYGKENNPGLKPHTDAVDNEITMTTHVTQTPDVPAWMWPIYFVEQPKSPVTELGTWEKETKPSDPGVIPAHLWRGDAMLFRGRRHPHFREALDPKNNQSYGNLLSHFVLPDYPTWMSRARHNQLYANDVSLPERGHEFIR